MDLDEEILSDFSDSEIVESTHKNLLDTISTLDKKSRLKPASRKEASVQISEYHLINKNEEGKKKKKLVDVNSLVKSLKNKPNNVHIAKKITDVQKSNKNLTLPKPLEKIHADKIEREVAFNNVKEDLSKWDPIVFDNRISDQLSFPLKKIDNDLEEEQKKEKSHHAFLNNFEKPSELELALANILDSSKVVTQYREEKERREREIRERKEKAKNGEFQLTLKEMREKQREFSKLRAQKAFKEKKTWMQNKIKSKKYHRLLKREKVKEKLKEFEKLQKVDPEAALQQLQLLDKTRAQERISLRHKSTGKWAKNLTVRAKYDKESRIALAEQLSQSKALTQKVKRDASSDEEDEDSGVEQDGDDDTNPWMKKVDAENVGSYFSGYRKYWQEKVNTQSLVKPSYESVSVEKIAGTLDGLEDDEDNMPIYIEHIPDSNKMDVSTQDQADKNETKNEQENKHKNRKRKRKKNLQETDTILNESGNWVVSTVENGEHIEDEVNSIKKMKVNGEQAQEETDKCSKKKKDNKKNIFETKKLENPIEQKCDMTNDKKGKKRKKNKSRDVSSETYKNAVNLSSDLAIDSAFDNLEAKMKSKVQNKVKKIVQSLDETKKPTKGKPENSKGKKNKGKQENSKGKKKEKIDWNDRKKAKKVIDVDAPLQEEHVTKESIEKQEHLKLIGQLGTEAIVDNSEPKKTSNNEPEQIDPNEFLKIDKNVKVVSRKVPQVTNEGALDDDEDGSENESADEGMDAQQMTIEEAFADDDVVQEFRQEKEDEKKKADGTDIDLTLPGWGSWGGAGTSKKALKKKRQRFLIKTRNLARKDEKKPIVIINENKSESLKQHLVDEIPYPFKSVSEYEASLRAPIGREWVPEIAHRKLIEPAIKTKLGTIIEPIDYNSQMRDNGALLGGTKFMAMDTEINS